VLKKYALIQNKRVCDFRRSLCIVLQWAWLTVLLTPIMKSGRNGKENCINSWSHYNAPIKHIYDCVYDLLSNWMCQRVIEWV